MLKETAVVIEVIEIRIIVQPFPVQYYAFFKKPSIFFGCAGVPIALQGVELAALTRLLHHYRLIYGCLFVFAYLMSSYLCNP